MLDLVIASALRGEIVCGLHVHSNVRVIPAIVNLKKGNRHHA